MQGNLGELALSLISLYAIIIIVRTFSLKPKFFKLYSSIALLTFLLEIVGRMELYNSWTIDFLLSIQVVYILYLGGAAYLILRDILLSQQITIDTIRGSICVYLLIGFVWALLYGITSSLDSNAFSQSIVEIDSYGRAIYFSFTTLTTLGYGDIIPVSPLAKMLTNLEAIIGQLYPAILIAILVGGYISQRSK
ncbi:MAG: potassium channel family protein [Cyanobacteria bacterium P01_A01_bin.40]